MSSSTGAIKKKNIVKKKKKSESHPNYPQTGYVRYINENRERIRLKNSGLEPVEITKLVAEEWRKLSEDKRKPYLDAADVDKTRYHRECDEFKQSEAKKAKIEKTSELVKSKPTTPETKVPATTTPTAMTNGSKEIPMIKPQRTDYDIPIFTDEFLEHNKVKDQDLRNLRKSNTDYEQQNSVLEKHVENMKNGIDKLEMETNSLRSNNATLQCYLDKLRSTLANSALQALAIPSEPNGATLLNIDKYMADLNNMAESNSHGPASLNKAKDIIRKLDLHSIST